MVWQRHMTIIRAVREKQRMVLNTDMPDSSTEPTGSVQRKKKKDHFIHEVYDNYLLREIGAPHYKRS